MPRQFSYRANHQYAGIAARTWIKTKRECRTYEQYAKFLGKETKKQIASNVSVVRLTKHDQHGPGIAIQLYHTNVLIFHANGTFEADNGGYDTLTTKSRCNQFGPEGVYFWHHKRILCCNRGPCKYGTRYPVKKEIIP